MAPAIKAGMQKAGMALIGFQSDEHVEGGDVNFFRIVFAAADLLVMEDVDRVMAQIEQAGREL